MPRDCGCAGGCGPQEDGISRRELITLAGVGAGALAGGPAWAHWIKQQAPPAQLAAWKADLLKPAAPRRYLSQTHTDARMPLGGIGTGNFELGVDGQFTTWQLFNTLRDGYVPFCFAVKAGSVSKMLQTAGGPEWPRVRNIEMTGEYPFATLRFIDADLPVQLEMTAFTPFAPLDAQFSALPVACFVFKIHNPTKQEQTVSLAGFLQNVVGYDAVGVPISFNSIGFNAVPERQEPTHPNFGGNVNRAYREGKGAVLAMEGQPGATPTLDRPTRLYTNVNVGALLAPPNDRPKSLEVFGLDRLPAEAPANAAGTVVWLEEAPTDLPAEVLRAARGIAQAGGTLLFAGKAQPLLQSYGELTQGKPLEQVALSKDVLFEDFEHGYENWTVEGTAFGKAPAHGTLPGQQEVTGFLGQGLVNSFLNGDDTTGKLISKPFTVTQRYIRFLVGGGRFRATQIRLLVEGKIVRATSGRDEERLLPAFWDVREFAGKQAHIEIVDEQQGGWGHINVDQIVFSDDPGNVAAYALLEEMLPARFRGVRTEANQAVLVDSLPRSDAHESTEPQSGLKVLSRSFGTGTVVLALGTVLEHENAELIGARQRAYAIVCDLAGAHYVAPVGVPETAPGHGALALMTLGPDQTALTTFEDWQEAWKTFAADGRFQALEGSAPSTPTPTGHTVNGALASTVAVPAGKTIEVPFFLAWRYPNKYNGAGTWMGCHYAETWKEVGAVCKEVAANFSKIRARTEGFRKAVYDSTLPYWLLDCVTSQISTIRHSGVVFRIANGDVFGWEGSNGCCQPTCTHVWGYVQTLARLFPDLERQMREIDYKHQQRPDGGIDNRTDVPSPLRPTGERPFSDGHASCVLKAYREALNAPDASWLKAYWPGIKKAVEYLIARDAATSGGVPDGTLSDDQWNTYDNAIHGVNTFIGSYYLAALRAGEELAKRMGDNATAERFHAVFEKGQKRLVELCWNGEYFEQHLPDYLKRSGEYGPGCLSDQLIGQWWAHQLGLGYVLPKEHVQTALKSVFKYNWLPDFSNFHHNWRKFAGGTDKGLLICSWPKGGRPASTIPYVDEVWTGVEYQVAAHMLYEGMLEEGLAIVKGARDRYDGAPRSPMPRNPWNEIECGGHYARAMSSWSLLLALSGFRYDGINATLHFAPRHQPDNFKAPFTGPEGWGSLTQTRKGAAQRNEIALTEGRLKVAQLHLDAHAAPKQVKAMLGGKAVPVTFASHPDGVIMTFAAPVTIQPGRPLVVSMA